MSYTIKFSKRAAKEYSKLPPTAKIRIDQKLGYLQETPRGTDTKKLTGYTNVYRTRVEDYRIVYEIEDADLIVWIVDMGHRKEIYK